MVLPPDFCAKSEEDVGAEECSRTTHYEAYVCVLMGIAGGLIIGLVTEVYTSKSYPPVKKVRSAPWS